MHADFRAGTFTDTASDGMADGKPVVTDGPFIETKEVLGGYRIIDASSKQAAIDRATPCPASTDEIIEIRQIMEFDDFPPDVREAAAGFDEMLKNPRQP